MEHCILALDQGTSGSRAILFDTCGRPVASDSGPSTQIYPRPGWVEQSPEEIWSSQLSAARGILEKAGVGADSIVSTGITNQRGTTIVWDRKTGHPVCNAIVWQCRRTAAHCETLKRADCEQLVRECTGVVLDAYFSGAKIAWILDNIDGVRARSNRGELAFGTVDPWLIWNLTGGKVHATDVSNASRTMLFDIHKCSWDDALLAILNTPHPLLHVVRQSSEIIGRTTADLFGREIPIAGVAGDQQAALFGQTCFERGDVRRPMEPRVSSL